jgi:hypothetical protein
MIVDDFDIVGLSLAPAEADSPLVTDSDTVLASAGAAKLLQAISRRQTQVVQRFGGVKHAKLTESNTLQVKRPPADGLPVEQALGFTV